MGVQHLDERGACCPPLGGGHALRTPCRPRLVRARAGARVRVSVGVSVRVRVSVGVRVRVRESDMRPLLYTRVMEASARSRGRY